MAETVPEIELIIKASTIDGRRKGACIFCQVMRDNDNKDVMIIDIIIIITEMMIVRILFYILLPS